MEANYKGWGSSDFQVVHLYLQNKIETRLGVPSIAGRLLKHVYMIYDMRRGHIAGNIDLRNQTLMGYNIHDKKTKADLQCIILLQNELEQITVCAINVKLRKRTVE